MNAIIETSYGNIVVKMELEKYPISCEIFRIFTTMHLAKKLIGPTKERAVYKPNNNIGVEKTRCIGVELGEMKVQLNPLPEVRKRPNLPKRFLSVVVSREGESTYQVRLMACFDKNAFKFSNGDRWKTHPIVGEIVDCEKIMTRLESIPITLEPLCFEVNGFHFETEYDNQEFKNGKA